MSSAALILGSDEEGERASVQPLMLRVAGQTLLERQVRQAVLGGASHIIIMVTELSGAIVAEIDKLKADKLPVVLVRNAREAADHIHPDEDVLYFFGPIIIDNEQLQSVIATASPALLTLPARPEFERFERIDAKLKWAGLGKTDGTTVRETAARLGEWALGPTLLRVSVQQSAKHVSVDAVLRADTQVEAVFATNDLFDREVKGAGTGWFDHIMAYLAKPIARFAAARNMSGFHAAIIGICIYFMALSASVAGILSLSYLLFALAALPASCARLVDQVSVSHRPIHPVFRRWRWLLLVVIIGADAYYKFLESSNIMFIIICLWIISIILLIRMMLAADPRHLLWRNDTGGIAAVLAISGLAGFSGFGLGLCIALLTGELAWRIRKISDV